MTSLKTSIKTITYLSDIGCLEIQGASLPCKGWYDKKRLDDGTGYQCKDTINNVGYLAKTKV
ncbi:hypothetical protein ACSLOK_23350, partial [Escherichia coli]|uniref:hypothetical protein n=1 Tax=Escherichia coli TaxID=562 RepID=UPI003EE3F24E